MELSAIKLVNAMQELIRQSIDVNKFSDISYGTVESIDPLKIKINEYITLEPENIILTNAVKDHEIDVTVSWYTENVKIPKVDNHTHSSGTSSGVSVGVGWSGNASVSASTDINSEHRHEIKDKKKIIIHNALKKGEKVLMIKAYGGQQYVVIDRLSKYECEGEWNE